MQSVAAVALMPLMILFAAYTAAETDNAFQWAEQPPKIATSPCESEHPSNTWFLVPIRVTHPNDPFIPVCRLTDVTNKQTDPQTDHATASVANSNRLYLAIAVMQPD